MSIAEVSTRLPGSSARWRANVVLLVVTMIWGATFTLTKTALVSVPAMPFLASRFVIAVIFLVPFVVFRRASRASLRQARTYVVGGVLGIVLFLGYATQTLGLLTVSPARAGFLTGLSVVLVPIVSVLSRRASSTKRLWIATFLALLALLVLNHFQWLSFQSGDALILLCALCFALQINGTDSFGTRLDSMSLAFVEILVVAACSAGVTAFSTIHHPYAGMLAPRVLLALLLNGAGGTSFAYAAQTYFQRHTSAAQIAIIFTLEPVFAAIFAVFLYGERLSSAIVLGGLLILGSMFFADEQLAWFRRTNGRRSP